MSKEGHIGTMAKQLAERCSHLAHELLAGSLHESYSGAEGRRDFGPPVSLLKPPNPAMRIITLDLGHDPPVRREVHDVLQQLVRTTDRLASARWHKLVELVQFLCSDGPFPEAWGQVCGDALHLSPANSANRVTVQVWTDWRDYGPAPGGLPLLHYRLQVRRPSIHLSENARVESPDQARDIIWKAFGWLTET